MGIISKLVARSETPDKSFTLISDFHETHGPGASRVTQKPVALPSGAAAEMTRRLTRLKVAIEDDLTNL